VDEAVNMLLIACDANSPIVLAPELARPHFITDLAHFMAEELAPDRAVEIDFIGPRPGDKESERFWSSVEAPRPADEHGLLAIQSPIVTDAELETRLAALRGAVDARDLSGALVELCAIVPDYAPSSAVQSLAGHRVSSS
jgi:FlaA1/EpsC-like NDP-sugar epimerase